MHQGRHTFNIFRHMLACIVSPESDGTVRLFHPFIDHLRIIRTGTFRRGNHHDIVRYLKRWHQIIRHICHLADYTGNFFLFQAVGDVRRKLPDGITQFSAPRSPDFRHPRADGKTIHIQTLLAGTCIKPVSGHNVCVSAVKERIGGP